MLNNFKRKKEVLLFFKIFALFFSVCVHQNIFFFSYQNIVSYSNSIRLMTEKPDNVKRFVIYILYLGGGC